MGKVVFNPKPPDENEKILERGGLTPLFRGVATLCRKKAASGRRAPNWETTKGASGCVQGFITVATAGWIAYGLNVSSNWCGDGNWRP